MHVVVWFCLNVFATLSLSVYVQVDFRTFVHVNAKSMPSSMVKYVSKKYLCVTIGMRNESKMFIRTKHTLWNKYMQGIPAPSAPKFCEKKTLKCETNKGNYVIYAITRMCESFRSHTFSSCHDKAFRIHQYRYDYGRHYCTQCM